MEAEPVGDDSTLSAPLEKESFVPHVLNVGVDGLEETNVVHDVEVVVAQEERAKTAKKVNEKI